MPPQLHLSDALEGYQLAATLTLAKTTQNNYAGTFRLFQQYLDEDPPLDAITPRRIEKFLASLGDVSPATIRTRHIHLAAFWTWLAANGYADKNILHQVDVPSPKKAKIIPYTELDIKRMLGVLDRSKKYSRPGKRTSDHTLPNGIRNRAIILTLLDTGVRATELCTLEIRHADLANRRLNVENGKGYKDRQIPYSARTAQAIWRYLATRKDEKINAPLFLTDEDTPFNRHSLRRQLSRIGTRAGVQNVGCHRFRHTFAITFLRNGIAHGGPNPWALQEILGHTDMQTVKIYLRIAQADVDTAHETASPVENWRL